MLDKLLEAVVNLAIKAELPRVLPTPEGTSEDRLYVAVGGEMKSVPLPPPNRHHKMESLSSFASFLLHDASMEQWSDLSVWYSRMGITAVLGVDRRDFLDISLCLTPQILSLQTMESCKRRYKHRDILALLRHDFHGCTRDTLAEDAIRSLKFSYTKAGSSETVRGKESLGRDIVAELSGAKGIPEFVFLDVPVFVEMRAAPKRTVKCVLDIFPETEDFAFTPLPGEVEDAIYQAERQIGIDLEGLLKEKESVGIYYGQA